MIGDTHHVYSANPLAVGDVICTLRQEQPGGVCQRVVRELPMPPEQPRRRGKYLYETVEVAKETKK